MPAAMFSHIGDQIAKIRKMKGLTIEELAKKTGLYPLRVAQIEAGQVRATTDELYQIKTALGVDLKDLYRDMPPDDDPFK